MPASFYLPTTHSSSSSHPTTSLSSPSPRRVMHLHPEDANATKMITSTYRQDGTRCASASQRYTADPLTTAPDCSCYSRTCNHQASQQQQETQSLRDRDATPTRSNIPGVRIVNSGRSSSGFGNPHGGYEPFVFSCPEDESDTTTTTTTTTTATTTTAAASNSDWNKRQRKATSSMSSADWGKRLRSGNVAATLPVSERDERNEWEREGIMGLSTSESDRENQLCVNSEISLGSGSLSHNLGHNLTLEDRVGNGDEQHNKKLELLPTTGRRRLRRRGSELSDEDGRAAMSTMAFLRLDEPDD